MKLHRNSQKRIYLKDAAYFVTVKTINNEPYFREPIMAELFVEQLRMCKYLKQFELYGWVLMPDHFHMIVRPKGKWNYSDIVHSLKRNVSRDINKVIHPPEGGHPHVRLINNGLAIPHEFIDAPERGDMDPRVRGDRIAGIRDDKDRRGCAAQIIRLEYLVIRSRLRFILKYDRRQPLPPFRWQESFHDHYIRNDCDFRNHVDYIARNPAKHGLPQNWPFVFSQTTFGDLSDPF